MPINSPEIKKIPITPKKAFNLNSNALLWAAVKQKAKSNTTTNHNNTDDSYTQDPLNNTTNTNTATTSNLLTDNELTAFGTNGEVFLVFDKLIELWDWQQPLTRINDTTTYTTGSGSLYLISSVLIDKPGKLLLIQPLVCDRLGLKYKLLIKLNDSFHILDIINNQLTPLEFKSTSPSITIKSGLDFFVISDHTGQLHLFDIHTYKKLEFNSIAKSVNNRTIFDIQGNLLVYNLSPSDTLVKYLKPITSSNKKKPTSDLSLPLTPIKLSRPNTMLQKIWKNLSSNTIDSIYKISEISESKIKNYFYPHQQQQQQQQQPASQSNKKNLLTSENFKILLSTIINTITGESNYISIIDLSTQSPLLIFTPPDGCSHVSLSPYDMLLSTTSSRGDSIFIWDYSNLSNKIILLEKYKRGKTPGIINKLIWSKNNNSIVILSQKSGSIHCFNNNINELGELEINKLKSWILPNFESTDIIIGPKLSILNNTVYKINNKRDLIDLNNKFIDNNSIILSLNKDKKILKIISLSGEINWKFDLPVDYQSDSPELIKPTDITDPIVELPVLANPIDPLNFAEIQTHEPLRTLYNKRQFEFSTYVHQNTEDGEEEGKYDSFVSNLNKFDHALQIKIINFGNSKKNSILDSLNTNSNDSLLINNTNNNNYTYNKVHPILDEDANIDIEDDEDIIDIPSSTPDLSRDIIPIEN